MGSSYKAIFSIICLKGKNGDHLLAAITFAAHSFIKYTYYLGIKCTPFFFLIFGSEYIYVFTCHKAPWGGTKHPMERLFPTKRVNGNHGNCLQE